MKNNTKNNQKIHKYMISGIALIIITFVLAGNMVYAHKIEDNIDRVEDLKQRAKVESQEEIADTLIRFHVLANSDADMDQDVKIKVRDAILNEITPYLEKSQDLEETRTIIQDKTQDMIHIAKKVLQKNGFNYGASASLGQHNFPTKYYGKFTLPAGEYEAFRIVLGQGKGSNWWCVMFPPLCFINVDEDGVEKDTGDVEVMPQGEEKIEDLIQPATNIEVQEEEPKEEAPVLEENQEPVEIRWKFVDVLQSIFSVFE